MTTRITRVTAASGALALCLGLGAATAGAAGSTSPEPLDPRGQSAKNVIMLIGDGMGSNMVDLASLYESGDTYHQLTHDPATGETEYLPGTATQVYQEFPVQTWQSHFAAGGSYDGDAAWSDFDYVKSGATDSAAAGTALATGVKTTNGTLGLDPEGNPLRNMAEVAADNGKAAGVVSSVGFSHATPAAYAANVESRNDYHSIASQMINSPLDVIIGTGHPYYDGDAQKREADYTWLTQGDFEDLSDFRTKYTWIETNRHFERVAANKPLTGRDYAPGQNRGEKWPTQLFGLVQVDGTLQHDRSGEYTDAEPYEVPMNDVPGLDTLTTAALNVLDRNEKDGFFLMVEGGAIDWAGHGNSTPRMIEEQIDFNHSVEAAVEWVEKNSSWEETMIVVTADHETGYLAGEGADPAWTALTSADPAGHSWHSGGHTNALVPVYAKGAGAELLNTYSDGTDPVLGEYVDNTTIGRIQMALMGG